MTTRTALTTALVLAGLASVPANAAAATCAPDAKPVPGGEWRQYGQSPAGMRMQPAETKISPDTAGGLVPQWAFNTTANEADGTFQSTPTIADGCMFLGSSTGWAFAVNADSGELVWKHKMDFVKGGLLGSGAVGAPIVQDGRVIFLISEQGDGEAKGPNVMALDQATGKRLWGPRVIETKQFAYANSSPVIHDGVVFAGFNGDESYDDSRGGFALLDAQTGQILKKTYVIDDAEYLAGAGGGSIWATPVIDEATGFAYVGSANPTGKIESDRTNAILKIDLNRESPTFGEIVESVKGTPDSISPITPLCGLVPGKDEGIPFGGEGATSPNSVVGCTRGDFDFGASPNMTTIDGRPAVVELQKSGVVHAATIDNGIEKAWEAVTGPGFFYDNLATTASDGENVYVTAGPPGQLIALDADNGQIKWVAPIGDQLHFQSVTVANGVVYTIDSLGWLWAWDAKDGTALVHRQLSDDGGDTSGFANASSVGIAVARNSLYVADGNYVLRYVLGAGDGGNDPGLPGAPEIPTPAAAAIVAGPAGNIAGYATPQSAVLQGGTVNFANGDAAQHDVKAIDKGADGQPLFKSKLIGIGQVTAVEGVEKLAPGDYGFFCSLHGNMTGTLKVVGGTAADRRAARGKQRASVVDELGQVVRGD